MARIAMPVAQGFEDSELTEPLQRLQNAGHQITLLGLEAGQTVEGKRGQHRATIDKRPDEVKAEDFDVLVIPGGHSPDRLRKDAAMVAFVKSFGELDRPIAAVCHGPQLLIEAGLARGKRMTSWPEVQKELEDAGAEWVDQEVCIDGRFITSRKPADLPAFTQAIEERIPGPEPSGTAGLAQGA